MDKGFFHPARGYWQTIGEPPQAVLDAYPEGTVEVPLKPSADHDWNGTEWVHSPQPVSVPDEATVLQLYDEMDQAYGIDLEAAVGGRGPKPLTRFRLANTIRRADPIVAQLQTALGWTDAQVDALFRAAAAR